MNIALLCILLAQDPAGSDLIKTALDGDDKASAEAIAKLEASGPQALPLLAVARLKHKDSPRLPTIEKLMLHLRLPMKRDVAARRTAYRLQHSRITLGKSTLQEAAALIRTTAEVDLLIDPAVDASRRCDVDMQDAAALDVLRAVTSKLDLDFDWRYDSVWISTPARVWGAPKASFAAPLTSEQQASAFRLIARIHGWNTKLADRHRARLDLTRLGPSLLASAFSEFADGTADWSEALEIVWGQGEVPSANLWETSVLGEKEVDIGDKVRAVRLVLNFEGTPIADVMQFLQEVSGIAIKLSGIAEDTAVMLVCKDITMRSVLAALTLPRGMDVRIESETIVVFDPKRK